MKLCCFSVINMKSTLQAFTFIFFQHRYRRTDATDFSMFSLAPMLPMFDVRIGRTLNKKVRFHDIILGIYKISPQTVASESHGFCT